MPSESSLSIPIQHYPDPILACQIESAELVVRETNDAFQAEFGDSSDTTVFEEFPRLQEQVTHSLSNCENDAVVFNSGFDDTAYFVRVLSTTDSNGFVIFLPVEEIRSEMGWMDIPQVTSVISHDLRNPLDVAMAHLEAARETGDSEHFEAVAEAHDRMRKIIRDVLTVARGDSVIDSAQETDLSETVSDAWDAVESESATLDLQGPLPAIQADQERLQRLFENLFRNSLEHGGTDEQSGSRSVSTNPDRDGKTRPSAGVTVTVGRLDDGFFVADDGPGIPSDARHAVFEPGYSSAGGGAGLGLSIVQRIATAHGWEVDVTNATTGGARFEIHFGSDDQSNTGG